VTSDRRVIGVDEAGKGDFFGPLVTAAIMCPDSDNSRLAELGVRDSKLISDNKLLGIDEGLRALYTHAVIVVSPEKYNERYSQIKNLNKLLADCHAEAIQQALKQSGAELAVSDKFGKPELIERALGRRRQHIALKQIVRGERIPQVAAASILARARFLREMSRLSDEYGVEIPRGAASKVDAAGRRIVQKYGEDVLVKLAKIHFKNYGRVLSPDLFAR
jgi:ribonuclease HIII